MFKNTSSFEKRVAWSLKMRSRKNRRCKYEISWLRKSTFCTIHIQLHTYVEFRLFYSELDKTFCILAVFLQSYEGTKEILRSHTRYVLRNNGIKNPSLVRPDFQRFVFFSLPTYLWAWGMHIVQHCREPAWNGFVRIKMQWILLQSNLIT